MCDQERALRPGLELILFGGPKVTAHTSMISLSPFQGTLLALLAVSGINGIHREAIFPFLWDSGSTRQLRKRLSQLIYSIHKRLSKHDLVASSEDRLILNRHHIKCDLDAFRAAQVNRDPASLLALLSKGFLPLLRRTATQHSEQWMLQQTLRLEAEVRSLATERWCEAERKADWQSAERLAKVLLCLDHRSESSLRKLLRAKALGGKVREAEAAYKNFHELARAADPSWVPHHRTEALVQRLDQIADHQRRFTQSHRASAESTPPLLGRAEELELLTFLIANPPADAARTILVTGEGGIGKTRLIEEALAIAPLHGVRSLMGRCAEFTQHHPLGLLLDILSEDWTKSEIGTLPQRFRDLLRIFFQPTCSIESFNDAEMELVPGQVSRGLCEAVRGLLYRLTEAEPLVIFVDDLQWIDRSSLSVLEYVQQRWSGGNLTLILSFRTNSPSLPVSPSRHFARQINDSHFHLIRLEELTEKASRKLIEWSLQGAPSEHWIESILSAGGGIPLFLIHATEVFRSRPISGKLLSDGVQVPVPPSIHPVLEDRVGELSSTAVTILDVLTAATRDIDTVLGLQLTRLPPSAWSSGLEEIEERFLLRWSGSGVRLRHDLIRTFLRNRMSESHWREINRRFAMHLTKAGESFLGELTFHLLESGQASRARTMSRLAARQAERTGAYAEALQFRRVIVDLDDDQPERVQDVVQYAMALYRFGHLELAYKTLGDAYRSLAKAGRSREATKMRLARLECAVRLGLDSPEKVMPQLGGIRGRTSEREWWELYGQCMDLEIKVALAGHPTQASRELHNVIQHALATLPRISNDAGRMRVYQILSLKLFCGDPAGGLEAAEAALSIAKSGGREKTAYISAGNRLLMCLIALGELASPKGRKLRTELQELAEGARDPLLRCYPAMNASVWRLRCGDAYGAIDTLQDQLPFLEAVEVREVALRVRSNLGLAYLQARHFDQARKELDIAMTLLSPLSPASVRATLISAQGLCALQEGDYRRAREFERQVSSPNAPWVGDPTIVSRFRAEMYAVQGRAHKGLQEVRVLRRALRLQFPIHWATLTLEEGILTSRFGLEAPRRALAECFAWAASRGLEKLAQEAKSQLSSLDA